MKKILIADDEPDILELLQYNLSKEGFEIHTASNGAEALTRAVKIKPDMIILDVMMPELDGIETCRKLKEMPEFANTYILFLSARAEDYTQIIALDVGADDYIIKPIKLRVLISKIKAVFRRTGQTDDDNKISISGLLIDKNTYTVRLKNKEIELPKKEFELLHLLATKPNRIFTRDEIYNRVWGEGIIVGDRTIDVHIRKIRDKLGDEIIKTIKGVGYKFEINE
ncbi:MAG: DNA-binding response regulator [Bacteroidetes bacterium RIFOXYA12_FULL_35_11]|nr:MAG: DNA-binding response regulator [Bacteroidetes bacterium GWF2_35_48]OFY76564.1 MAG: DNA-binding response regulator [Bacteroidetes bacterium RIFOXYA12_FULL_35_11]OFZ01105.1 MAG: DNA-binding response regulator [Bacteroidetes bacterium RIFOXYC12_FULL_35_7]HBX52321.1 DNA-binding response regulator [Bacteroidales bacterium]